MHFVENECFDQNVIEISSLRSKFQSVSTAAVNALAPKRWQAIMRTIANPVHRCIYAQSHLSVVTIKVDTNCSVKHSSIFLNIKVKNLISFANEGICENKEYFNFNPNVMSGQRYW